MRSILRGVPGYDPFQGAAGCWFDEEAARFAIAFIEEMLVHIEGELKNQPFLLEPWQKAIVANLFGWKKRDEFGRVVRRYREVFIYIPRKNGKTPLCACIAALAFFLDDEPGQQGYIAAKDREQAGHLFRQLQGMIEANPALRKRCRVYGGTAPAGQSRSFVKPDGSFLKIISGDGSGKHGGNPHIVIVDELHEQDNRELLDALQTSMVSKNRKQSIFVQLTTADFDRPSICNDKYEHAKRVRDEPGKDPSLLPVIYEADPHDDPHDLATWKKCNPNLGVSVSEFDLRRLSNRAKEDPGFAVEFKRLHLNIRTRPVVANAINMAHWDACGEPFDVEDLAGEACWAALDFGWRDDYAALGLVFPRDDGRVYTLAWLWLPQEGKRDRRAEPTARFIADGLVSLTPGNATDIEAIYQVLRDLRRRYDLRKVVIDPANARKQGQDLMNDGFEVHEFFQSMRNYTEPWKWLMSEGLANGKIRHGGNKALRWMAGNVAVEVNGLDQVMPRKKRSLEKIDGICALAMAIGAWLADATASSYYNPEPVIL